MIYNYYCVKCADSFDLHTTIAKRDDAIKEPCKKCGGELKRAVGAPGISSQGAMTIERRAGHEWRDRLGQIKKNAGRGSTIETW